MVGVSFKGKAGLSITELLLITTLLLILAAFLFPTFKKIREQSRRTACVANLKILGTAIILYSSDYNGKVPIRVGLGIGNPRTSSYLMENDGTTGVGLLYPKYLKDKRLFYCPSNLSAYKKMGSLKSSFWDPHPVGINPATHIGYWYLSGGGPRGGDWDKFSVLRNMTLSTPAAAPFTSRVLIADRIGEGGGAINLGGGNHPFDRRILSRIRADGGNYLFADGHVKWSKLTSYPAGTGYTGWINEIYFQGGHALYAKP